MLCLNGLFVSLVPRPGAAASYRGNRAKIRIFPAPSQFPPHLLGAGAKIGGRRVDGMVPGRGMGASQ